MAAKLAKMMAAKKAAPSVGLKVELTVAEMAAMKVVGMVETMAVGLVAW